MTKKTLTLFLLTLVSTLVGCSKNDDNSGITPNTDVVKEIHITTEKGGNTTKHTVRFTYNTDHTLSQITGLKTSLAFEPENIRYEYSNTNVMAYVTENKSKSEDVYDFRLSPNEKKAISLKVSLANTEDTNRRYDFSYNELNQLVKIENTSDLNHDIEEYIWEDENPLKTKGRTHTSDTYRRSDVLNNSNIDLNVLVAAYPNFINPRYAAIQGLLGVKATNLLEQLETSERAYTYTYQLNEKGTVSQVVRTLFYKKENTTEKTTFDIKY